MATMTRALCTALAALLASFASLPTANAESGYQLLASYPRSAPAFTQGLEIYRGRLYESSGLYDKSYVRYGTLDEEGTRLQLPAELFAEGLTILNDKLYLLTWKAGRCLVLHPETLATLGEFRYRGEGWGITNNRRELILSNGSAHLSFINPDSLATTRTLQVHYRGRPVPWLNELEWHDGYILANQWQRDHLLVIDEQSGQVVKIIDLRELYPAKQRSAQADVLNGIAYDAATDSWLITGKYWPNIYRLKLSLPPRAAAREAGVTP